MKMNNTCKDLLQRTGVLYDEISDRIRYEEINFCKHCADHGRFCGIKDAMMEEKEKLIAIQDSLKDLQNMLQFYQVRHFIFSLIFIYLF